MGKEQENKASTKKTPKNATKKAPSVVPKDTAKKASDDITPKNLAKEAPSIVPKKDEKKSKKGLRTFFYIVGILCWTAAAVILSQIIVGYIMLLIVGKDTFLQPVPTLIYSALSYIVAMVALIFISKRASRRALGLHGSPTWTDIGLAPAGYLAYLVLAFLFLNIFIMFPWFDANEAQNVGFSVYVFGFDRLVAFITLVIIAPIAEEIVFRGWLYGKMRAKLSGVMSNKLSMVISMLLVSLLFGAVHMQWNVGINVFALSLVLCALREINGTIYSGILLHMIKNGIAFYMMFVLCIV